ncbi:hypothetical protein [Thauera sp.]|uniref:hypothetical protein n=1 Tax=Thauera sp. TaxID=1905334 RepID=UPI0039E5194A
MASIRFVLVAVVLGLGLGGLGGYRLGTGDAARSELRDARGAVQTAADTLDAARRQLDTTTRAVAQAAARDAQTASRHLTEAAAYEQVIASAARLDCNRDPDAFRMLVDAIGRANQPRAATPGAPAAKPSTTTA